jgi:hypothetical protein
VLVLSPDEQHFFHNSLHQLNWLIYVPSTISHWLLFTCMFYLPVSREKAFQGKSPLYSNSTDDMHGMCFSYQSFLFIFQKRKTCECFVI